MPPQCRPPCPHPSVRPTCDHVRGLDQWGVNTAVGQRGGGEAGWAREGGAHPGVPEGHAGRAPWEYGSDGPVVSGMRKN
ncbi:hypothetical protein GCM10027075_40300 [Streptomyces heilongjiangensis]